MLCARKGESVFDGDGKYVTAFSENGSVEE
jgi:hypothetical protein